MKQLLTITNLKTMRKLLLLFFALLTGVSGAWAATVEWESYAGWTRNNVASVWWVGITTPGTKGDTYSMSSFQFAQETGYGAATRYTAIAKVGPTTSGAVLAESDVLGVSTNAVTASATEYYTYNLDSEIELTGATTYYMVFLSSSTPADGYYTVSNQRISLNTSYGTYNAGAMSSSGVNQSAWTPGFKATLTTDAVYTVTYTCYSSIDGSQIDSGTFEDVVGTITAPSVSNYVFDHATDADDNAFAMTTEITEDISLKFYYNPLLTYRFMFNETEVGTEDIVFTAGNAYPTPTTVPYGFSYTLPEGTVAASAVGTTVDLALTWTAFSYASSFNNITQWYLVRLHSNQSHYMYNNAGAIAFSNSVGDSNAYRWAFVGDPINGFTLYNYATGVAVDNATPCALSTEGTSIRFKAAYSAAGTNGASSDFYFALYVTSGSYLNYQSDAINRYSYNDEGSTFMLTATDLIAAPSTGKFYRFKGSKSDKYLKGETTTEADANGYYHMLNTTETDGAKSIFYYDTSKHFLSFYCGQYTTATSYLAGVGSASINTYKFEAPYKYGGAFSVTAEQSINSSGVRLYSHSDDKTYANQQGGKAEETDWYVEEVTNLPVTISTAKYATFNAPLAVTIPSGVTAYTGTINGSYLVLSALSEKIPANTPVVLYADVDVATTYDFDITTADAFEGDNDLEGTTAAITWPESGTTYTLQKNKDDSSTIGFYGNELTSVPGFKAYLNTVSDSPVKGFKFDFDTAVKAIEAAQNPDKAVYDINGRRVENSTKGLYIVNGKKVIIK